MKTKAQKRHEVRMKQKSCRERKREKGMVPMEIWVYEDYKSNVREYVEKLNTHAESQ